MPQAPARRDTSESSDVANLVRLHHRRRGWAWVAIGSVIGLVVYAGIDVNLFENLTGTARDLHRYPGLRAARSGSGRASCGNRRYITHSPRRRGRPGEREGQRFALPAVRSRASLSAAPPWQLGVRHLHARRDDWYHRGYPARRSELVGICGRRGEPGHLQPGVVWSGLRRRGRARGQLPHGDRRLPFQKRRGRHLGQPGATRPAVQRPRPALGLGRRADPHQWRRLGDPGDRRRPVLRWSNAPAAVHPRGDSARHAVEAKPADVRARWRRSGRSPPNTSSRSRSPPRKRRSSPCTPWASEALTIADG